jgi:hypothetical protein
MQRQLNWALELGRGWDGRDAPAPSKRAIVGAEAAIDILRRISSREARVVPDPAGGVLFYWFQCGTAGRRYATLSVNNGGWASVALVDAQHFRSIGGYDGRNLILLRALIERALAWVS